jgi:serine/threonine protein kinase
MDTKRICPSCQKPLAPNVPMGLCPECLIKAGFPTGVETDTGPAKQPAFVPPAVEEIAKLFPQLEILELIGKGGMGAVYKARQKQLNRFVALKILPPGIGDELAFAERFTREAQALAQLNHPGIVTLYEFGETSGQFYFLMEFVDGVNLRQLLAGSRVSAREALAIVPQICDALQFAHDQGIVHRDIKPENILLDRRGRVKVADFGLAKIVAAVCDRRDSDGEEMRRSQTAATENLTDAGKAMGTPNYMSPEQIQAPGEVDHRADIYALGVVFYQMLTGELPGKKIEPPSTKVQIDVRLDEIVLRALEKNPALRYQQVSEVKTGVDTIVATPSGSSRREEAQTEKSEIRNLKSETQPSFSRTTLVVALLIAIIGSTIALFYVDNSVKTTAVTLTQSEFLQKFASNQIAHATISLNRQSAPLMQIQGTYYQTDKDGVIVKQRNGKPMEVPFETPNVLLTGKMQNDLLTSPKIKLISPNTLLLSIGYQLLFFAGILLIPGIIIYIVWRAVKKSLGNPAPPLNQKPDHFWRWIAVAVLAMISIPILISIVGLLAAIAIPNFVKARERSRENAQHAAQMLAAQNLSIATSFVARLNQGEVELLAIGNQPWTNKVCWLPNGMPSTEPFATNYYGSMEAWAKDKVMKKIAFRIHNESSDGISYPVCHVNDESGILTEGSGMKGPDSRSQDTSFVQLIACPTDAETVNISVGVANGAWETATALEHGNNLGGASAAGDWSATYNAVIGRNDVGINCNYSRNTNWASRMVCVSDDGKITVIPENSSGVSTFQTGGILFVSSNEFAHIKEFQLQRRKFQWVEFRNVSLQSGHATTVDVKDFGGENQSVQTTPATPAAQSLSISPMIERTLVDSKNAFESEAERTNAMMMIDFDTGTLFSGSQAIWQADTDAQKRWMQTNGVDALCVVPKVGGLVCLDMKSLSVPPQSWDEIPANILDQLEHGARRDTELTASIDSDWQFPPTWLFQTREGGMGILQITGFTNNPRGVKIRYKLIQKTSSEKTGQTSFDSVPAAVFVRQPPTPGEGTFPMEATMSDANRGCAGLTLSCSTKPQVQRFSPTAVYPS